MSKPSRQDLGMRGPEVGKDQTKNPMKLGTEEWLECNFWLLFVSLYA